MRKLFVLSVVLFVIGCTGAEVREGFDNAGAAAMDTGAALLANPALATNPVGWAVLASIFAGGFLTRELGALAVRGTKPDAGALAKFIARIVGGPIAVPQPPVVVVPVAVAPESALPVAALPDVSNLSDLGPLVTPAPPRP